MTLLFLPAIDADLGRTSVQKKKVIFVGGTAYSGSTFFHMMLANDPHGFATGEVWALFNPIRPSHLNPRCSCGDTSCRIWREIFKRGEKNLYQSIFDLFPEVRFIVDSSKNPFRIKSKNEYLRKRDIQTKNILIWKDPLEFAISYGKRNQKYWDKDWIDYHRLYFTAIKDFKTIRYSELATSQDALIKICEYLKIPYFDSKQEYWNKQHHILFGNNNAKVHLNSDYDKIIEEDHKKNFRKIYYSVTHQSELASEVQRTVRESRSLNTISSILNQCNVIDKSNLISRGIDGTLPPAIYELRRVLHMAKMKYLKNRLLFKNRVAVR